MVGWRRRDPQKLQTRPPEGPEEQMKPSQDEGLGDPCLTVMTSRTILDRSTLRAQAIYCIEKPIDSMPGLPFKLQTGHLQFMHIYKAKLMPGRDSTLPSQLLGAFSPIWPGDLDLSDWVIRNCFHSAQDLPLLSFFASVTGHMRHQRIPLPRQSDFEYYAYCTVKALQKDLCTGQPSESMVLAISHLNLAEAIAGETSERTDVYPLLLQKVIIGCGGLMKIHMYPAQQAFCCDYLLALKNIDMPKLDAVRYPGLLGISPGEFVPRNEIIRLLEPSNPRLDPRVGQFGQSVVELADTVSLIQHVLTAAQIIKLRHVIELRFDRAYQHIDVPFRPRKAGISRGEPEEGVLDADRIFQRARASANLLWLWHCAVSVVYSDEPSTYLSSVLECGKSLTNMFRQRISEAYLQVEPLLHDTQYTVPKDGYIFPAALLCVTADNARELQTGISFFRYAVKKAQLSTKRQLEEMLVKEMIVDHIKHGLVEIEHLADHLFGQEGVCDVPVSL